MQVKGMKRTGAGWPPPFLIPLSPIPLPDIPLPHIRFPLWTEEKDGLAQRRRAAEKSLRVPASLHNVPFPAGGRGPSPKLPGRSAVGVRVLRGSLPNPEGSRDSRVVSLRTRKGTFYFLELFRDGVVAERSRVSFSLPLSRLHSGSRTATSLCRATSRSSSVRSFAPIRLASSASQASVTCLGPLSE